MSSRPNGGGKFIYMQTLTRPTLKIFWQHARRYTWMPYTLFLIVVAGSLFRNAPILFYRKLVDILVTSPRQDILARAVAILFVIIAIEIGSLAARRVRDFINNYFQPRVQADLLQTCYEYLQRHSIGFFNSNFVGSLVTKVKRYERSFEQLSDLFLYNLGRSVVELLIISGFLFSRNKILGLILFGWSIIFFVVVYFIAMYKLPYDLKRAKADTEVTAQLADTITNNFNIKVFPNYPLEIKRFAEVTENQFRARKKSYDLGTYGEIFQSAYMIILEFGLMYLAIRFWQKGTVTVGDLGLLQVYLFRIFDQLWDAGKYIRNTYEALADANEMTEILVKSHEIKDTPRASTLTVKSGRIEFINVNFGYHKELEILTDFTLSIKPGDRVALVGPSGGGKSTIVKLLLRFYDLQSGQILIDGQDIATVTQDSLRTNVALVPQDPILFHRSIMENIRYARPGISDEQVIEASKLAHAHEFISKFPDGYNTFVGERGVKLSGGERQRVAIARAILKDAAILILDEATSSLDSESEYFIQDALRNLMTGRTTIVIAHRLSTIMQMDRIVVIENGKILEAGKHKELIKAKKGTYQRLWNIQAGGFARV